MGKRVDVVFCCWCAYVCSSRDVPSNSEFLLGTSPFNPSFFAWFVIVQKNQKLGRANGIQKRMLGNCVITVNAITVIYFKAVDG